MTSAAPGPLAPLLVKARTRTGTTQAWELVRPQRDEGLQFPIVTMASSTPVSRRRPVRVATTYASSTSRLTDTPYARALAFSWSNSAWVIVPASRSCLADAI
jgi:hypothetical protein